MSLAAIGCGAILMGTFLIGARIANSNPQPITIEAPARLTPAPPTVHTPTKPVGAYAVTVMRAEPGTFRDTVPVSGSLVPREDLVVAPEVEGLRIVEVKVEPGAHVRRGDVLAVLASDSADTGLARVMPNSHEEGPRSNRPNVRSPNWKPSSVKRAMRWSERVRS